MVKPPVEVPVFYEVVYQMIRNLLRRVWLTGVLFAPINEILLIKRRVMTAEVLQNLFHPAPVLEHAAWHFAKVKSCIVAMKAYIFGSS
jgi:hypothetical protein